MDSHRQHSLLQSTRLFPQRVFVQLQEGVSERQRKGQEVGSGRERGRKREKREVTEGKIGDRGGD